MPDPTPRPIVAYIAGAGRSGSTLFDMILGSHSQVEGLGQVDDIKPYFAAGELCTCRRTPEDCPLWSKVLADRPTPGLLNATRNRDKVLGTLYALVTGRTRGADEEVEQAWDLLSGVSEVTGVPVVSDSSKSVLRLARLNTSDDGAKVRLLHLVRDPRGYVTSRGVARPNETSTGRKGKTPEYPMWKAVAVWLGQNLLVATYARLRCKGPTMVVRYEDLVGDSEATLTKVAEFLGLDYEPGMLPPFTEGEYHLVSGNDTRLWGYKELRVDERWRRELGKRPAVDRVADLRLALQAAGSPRGSADGPPGGLHSQDGSADVDRGRGAGGAEDRALAPAIVEGHPMQDAPLRVLVFSHANTAWGAQLRLLEQAAVLRGEGVELELACPPGGILPERWEALGLRHVELHIPPHAGLRGEGGEGRPGVARAGRRARGRGPLVGRRARPGAPRRPHPVALVEGPPRGRPGGAVGPTAGRARRARPRGAGDGAADAAPGRHPVMGVHRQQPGDRGDAAGGAHHRDPPRRGPRSLPPRSGRPRAARRARGALRTTTWWSGSSGGSTPRSASSWPPRPSPRWPRPAPTSGRVSLAVVGDAALQGDAYADGLRAELPPSAWATGCASWAAGTTCPT